MSNIFGGQGLFGNNQNKNQGTVTPGSTPATGTSAFGGLGSNTTTSSAFGGPGAGSSSTLGGGLFGNNKPADSAAKPATSSCEHETLR